MTDSLAKDLLREDIVCITDAVLDQLVPPIGAGKSQVTFWNDENAVGERLLLSDTRREIAAPRPEEILAGVAPRRRRVLEGAVVGPDLRLSLQGTQIVLQRLLSPWAKHAIPPVCTCSLQLARNLHRNFLACQEPTAIVTSCAA